MTLAEVLVVTLIVSLVTAIAGGYGMGWLRSERLRSNVYQVFVHVNTARVEAVNRNRSCRFTIDTASRNLRVIDLNDPAIPSDDEVLLQQTLGSAIEFATPSAGAAVTLNNLSGTLFETTFARDGSVASGSGSIHLRINDDFKRISVFAGGGVAVERWTGSAWETGS